LSGLQPDGGGAVRVSPALRHNCLCGVLDRMAISGPGCWHKIAADRGRLSELIKEADGRLFGWFRLQDPVGGSTAGGSGVQRGAVNG
jgi:hypothetical protein